MGLGDFWNNLVDKSWDFADSLEDKGIPLASLCENIGISPLGLLLVIIGAIVLLMLLFGGGIGLGGGSGTLNVKVLGKSGNSVGSGISISATSGQTTRSETTNAQGMATFENLPFGSYTVKTTSLGYTGSTDVKFEKSGFLTTLVLSPREVTLTVEVLDQSNKPVKSGQIEVLDTTGDQVANDQIDGALEYTFELEPGTYTINVRTVTGNLMGKRDVSLTTDKRESIVINDEIRTSTLKVIVRDENGQLVPGATVVVYDYSLRNEVAQADTDGSGAAIFNGLQMTNVYLSAYVKGNLRYAAIDAQDGVLNHLLDLDSPIENYELTLGLNGRVNVCVFDDQLSPVEGANVYISGSNDAYLSAGINTDGQGCAEFKGFDENAMVYPVVYKEGFLPYNGSSNAQPISYVYMVEFMQIILERDASVPLELVVTVYDSQNRRTTGIDAYLSDYSSHVLLERKKGAASLTFRTSQDHYYDLSLHKEGYLWHLERAITPGSYDVTIEDALDYTAADLQICTYTIINDMPADALATIELSTTDGTLVAVEDTAGGPDGRENCVVFADLPASWSLMAKAKSSGYTAVESSAIALQPRESGLTTVNLTFEQSDQPVAMGGVRICVKGDKNQAIPGASVQLLDLSTDTPTWSGDWEMITGEDGCALFENVGAEMSLSGTTVNTRVYPVVTAEGYAIYDGKSRNVIISVPKNSIATRTIVLGVGDSICITVLKGGVGANASVSLCEDDSCGRLIDTKKTENDGHVTFQTDLARIVAKVAANEVGALGYMTHQFDRSEVTGGQCGVINLEEVTEYVSVVISSINDTMTLKPQEASEVVFTISINGQPLQGSVVNRGTGEKVISTDQFEVKVSLEGVDARSMRTVDSNLGKYAIGILAPAQTGAYQITLVAEIVDCQTCASDMKTVFLTVDAFDDSDGDGVENDLDTCPDTPAGQNVDANGCPPSERDSDGDGITDDNDFCPGTLPNTIVDGSGCPVGEGDDDSDGVPNSKDKCPGTSPGSTVNQDGCSEIDLNPGMDSDGDGVPNEKDMCPGTPSMYQVDSVGCPIGLSPEQDADGDGVPNEKDMCPDTPKTHHVDENGCSTLQISRGEVKVCVIDPLSGTMMAIPGLEVEMRSLESMQLSGMQTQAAGLNCYHYTNIPIYHTVEGYADMQPIHVYPYATATGYIPYDGSGSPIVPEGSKTITIQMKKEGAVDQTGTGNPEDPQKVLTMIRPEKSMQWKQVYYSSAYPPTAEFGAYPQSGYEYQSPGFWYPVIKKGGDDEIVFELELRLQKNADAAYQYKMRYDIEGPKCFVFSNGQTTYEKIVNIYSGQSRSAKDKIEIRTSDDCWDNNDLELEGKLKLFVGGNWVGRGNTEISPRMMTPLIVDVEPLVGASRRINSVEQLRDMKDKISFSEGVVTSGVPPKCVPETRRSNVKGIDSYEAEQKEYKILIEFNRDLPDGGVLEDMFEAARSMITEKSQNNRPINCEVYMQVLNDDAYMGHVAVGVGKSNECAEAVYQGQKPWEVMFCKYIEGTVQDIDLKEKYKLKLSGG